MNKSFGPIAIVVVVAIIIAALISRGGAGNANAPASNSSTTVSKRDAPVHPKGGVSSEKYLAMTEEGELTRVLRDYNVTVEAKKLGSGSLIQQSTEGQSFLWPASSSLAQEWKDRGGRAVAQESVATTFLVIVAKKDVSSALKAKGLISLDANGTLRLDFRKLAAMMSENKSWGQLGLPYEGPIRIFSTSPRTSNSGRSYAALYATVLSGNSTLTEAGLQQTWNKSKNYFDSLGLLEESSSAIFKSYLRDGYPAIVCYENQVLELEKINPAGYKRLVQESDVIVPEPTMRADHPFIALDQAGERLLKVLLTDEAQRALDIDHGFRTSFTGNRKWSEIKKVIQAPSASVMERLADVVPLN